ncbi:MAG: nitrate reductase [Acetobacteraceae bacterium]
MASERSSFPAPATSPARRRSELLVFALLAIVVWPVVAVGVVGGWGLGVWMHQQVYGPPGPPAARS